jgi:hypothetical protein
VVPDSPAGSPQWARLPRSSPRELDRTRGVCKSEYPSFSNPPACGRWRRYHGVEHSPQLKLQQAVKFVHLY